MEPAEPITRYAGASTPTERALGPRWRELAWREDGTCSGPAAHVAGAKVLVDHIDGFFERCPEASSNIGHH